MTAANDHAKQRLLAAPRRGAARDLAPAHKDFTGIKALEAASERLAEGYATVLNGYAVSGFKITKRA